MTVGEQRRTLGAPDHGAVPTGSVSAVRAGEAAEFATMTPHGLTARTRPAELLVVFDRDGRNAHLDLVATSCGSGKHEPVRDGRH
jgi:hypothetical protein